MLKAFLLDVDYIPSLNALRLFLKKDGKTFRLYDKEFKPYFYLLPSEAGARKAVEELVVQDREGRIKALRVEEAKRFVGAEKTAFMKIFLDNPGQVPHFRDAVKQLGETFEYRILFTRRYLIDKGLTPSSWVEVEAEGKFIKSVKAVEGDAVPDLNTLAIDIETYAPKGVSDASKYPCLMASYAGKEKGVVSYGKKFSRGFVSTCKDEKQMLEKLSEVVREHKTDLLCTYNGDVFDLPYLAERAKRTHALLKLGRDRSGIKTKRLGLRNVSRLGGRIHFDVFNAVYFLDYIGAVKLARLTLERVYAELLGKKKKTVEKKDIWKQWDEGDVDDLADYCLSDSQACLDLAEYVLPLFIELGRVTGTTLFDASRFSSGQLVEALLMRKAFERNEVIPSKPGYDEVQARMAEPIQGAFVKLPEPGVYDNLAVLDFKSLYPSIIVSHNVDPSTIDCDCCKDAEKSPAGHRFCLKRKGLIPAVLDEVLNKRFAIQAQMAELKKESREYAQLYARQWALKILANSSYGVLLYPRFRWYNRGCGESITAFGRKYIQDTMARAEKKGFKVLYGDTDSIVMQFEKEEDVNKFRDEVNAALPGRMQLELEDIYPRGIFVAKKQEAKGAKKKYAFINKEGKIKIRGFELVRRDWSRVARDTQKTVLEVLLREGDVNKAVALVREVVRKLKDGEIPLEDCVIYTQLRKKTSAYEIKSPEVAAVLHARKNGLVVPEGSMVGYVITRKGSTISEKAQVAELAKDYDADYYVNNQVLPAVLKILGALGFDEDGIKLKGKQSSLGGW